MAFGSLGRGFLATRSDQPDVIDKVSRQLLPSKEAFPIKPIFTLGRHDA
jgi:hypothetical protein